MKHQRKLSEFIKNRFTALTDVQCESFIEYLNGLHGHTKCYLDNGFEKRILSEFESRSSEMMFVQLLLNNKMEIQHKSDDGLDIYISDIKGWGEFVTCTNGQANSENYLEKSELYVVVARQTNKIMLRIWTAISNKIKKHAEDLSKNRCQINEPVILFVSCGWLHDSMFMMPIGGVPDWFASVLPISSPILRINPNSKSSVLGYDYNSYMIKQKNGIAEKHETKLFLSEESKYISAIVFTYQNVLSQIELTQIGLDSVVLHNPMSVNPVRKGLFDSQYEFYVEKDNDSFRIIREVSRT